eukprot:399283-Rhodomonas_salina.6
MPVTGTVTCHASDWDRDLHCLSHGVTKQLPSQSSGCHGHGVRVCVGTRQHRTLRPRVRVVYCPAISHLGTLQVVPCKLPLTAALRINVLIMMLHWARGRLVAASLRLVGPGCQHSCTAHGTTVADSLALRLRCWK